MHTEVPKWIVAQQGEILVIKEVLDTDFGAKCLLKSLVVMGSLQTSAKASVKVASSRNLTK